MQKSKTATISMLVLIIIYIYLKVNVFININKIFTYIINPLFWIGFAIFLYIFLGKGYEDSKIKRKNIEYTVIASLIYIIIYLLSGLVLGFGKNPYLNTFKGICINIWILGVPIFSREYIRYKLINNVSDKDKIKFSIVITIIFSLIEFEFWKLYKTQVSTYSVYKQILVKFMPILSKNCLYTYLSFNSSYSSAIIYELLTNLYLWISPILPDTPWVVDSILNTSIPIVLLLYIRYFKILNTRFKTRDDMEKADPKSIIPLITIIIIGVWFALGVFPIKPVSIASGSMQDELHIGDVAIIKKCNPNDVNVGDIIEYQMENYTVIHRIVEKKERKHSFYFVTKGDSNSLPDKDEVSEDQLIGKVIYKIRYIGYPSIWLRKVEKEEQQV